MSNWIDYNLDVLAGSPIEINRIADRLKRPSNKLVGWVAERDGESAAKITEGLKKLFDFEATKNLGYVDPVVNQARRFHLSFRSKSYGIVDSHLFEISAEFPSSIFLLTYRDMMASYSGRRVMRGGEVVQEVHDGDQKVQSLDWILIDIFPPFLAEYYDGLEFGSLWQEWLGKLAAAVEELKDQASEAREISQTPDTESSPHAENPAGLQ